MSQINERIIPSDAFHDALLLRLVVDLTVNTAELEIRTHAGTVVLSVEEMTALKLDRGMSWGPSQSINTTTIVESTEMSELIVELQSGDVVRVTAKRFALRSGGLFG